MASVDMQDRVERFDEFFRTYYEDRIAELAQHYPAERRSLFIEWTDLYRFDEDLAADLRTHPEQLLAEAEEALRVFDLPVDISLGQAHVRVRGLPEITDIREIRAEHVNELVAVRGIVRKATGVKPRIEEAAFECQRCGTLTQIGQVGGQFQEPHECPGCERKGPFRLDESQSAFIDAQTLRVQESPEGLRGGQTPENIDVHIEDDVTGEVSPGDHVKATGILRLEQQTSGGEESTLFDVYMEGSSVEAEEEQFEEMEITEEDERWIIEQSQREDIYEKMVDSIAPSIYGYENAKLAMTLQLFSGVTKNLPDGSRTRGDMHLLLIGDPGTGKCVGGLTLIQLSDGSTRPIKEIVEEKLDDPVAIDDGYYQNTDFSVLSFDGTTIGTRRARRVWKREAPDSLYRIRTESGRKIVVTPSHPLFVQNELSVAPMEAEQVSESDFIAVPDWIPVRGDDRIDVTVRPGSRGNLNECEIPRRLTEEWARYLGYVIGEGYVQTSNNSVVVTNQDEEVIEDVTEILEKIGLRYQVRDHHTRETSKIVGCSSIQLVRFLRELESAILERSSKQRVPEVIQRATLPKVAEFLRAYIEGECSVSPTEREITVSSMSQELLKGVRNLLLRFEIESQIHSKAPHDSYRLRISGDNFERYVDEIGFVTERKQTAAMAHASTEGNTNRDVIPNLSSTLREIREKLRLSQFDCGVPRTTYQHYERGDRNPGRESLRKVVTAFEGRVAELTTWADGHEPSTWNEVERLRETLGISQEAISKRTDVTQTAISYYERKDAVPDGGVVFESMGLLAEELHTALAVEHKVERLRHLVECDIGWDRIESIEEVEPEDEWVYDLEVEGTHNYIAEGIVSHNSALLQYVRNIAPRSVYTSGKGSSAAGLCVTGDTRIETDQGERSIQELVSPAIPDPVDDETAVERQIPLRTFDPDQGSIRRATSSHAWRMPPKPCRRIETRDGRAIEASLNTPILTRSPHGGEWRAINDIEPGDAVAIPAEGSGAMIADGGTLVDGQTHQSSPGSNSAGDTPALDWQEVVAAVDTGEKEVFDLTVPATHNFIGNGIVTHNTAAAVRDDFGEGTQWSLEAGALVLADQGVAAIDELDKMRSEDRSALHEGLEAQEISISKAGINATLKARCSLLGAANPQYGRFDPYEPIGEQIDLEPALISRFDLIFTVTDQPDVDEDRELADHILETNYAGELTTRRDRLHTADVTEEEIAAVSGTVTPAIEPERFRKYVAFSKQSCFPRMTDEAREAIRDFYVDLRSKGSDQDAPVPVTARKLEALVRLAEASARIRLADTVELRDAERVIELVRTCLQDIGVDPETGEYDADVIETGRSKSQRDRIRGLKEIIEELQRDHDEGAPREAVLDRAESAGIDRKKAEDQIQMLRDRGEVIAPSGERLRLV